LTAKSDAHVFLVADPQSGKFEHPVVFVENGTHESWPGESGYMTTAGSHNGKGPSWLPKGLTLLARYDSDPNANTPFLHFNGAFGSDGASLVLHRTWCWPTDPSGHYAPCSHFYAPLLPHAVSIPDEVDHVPGNRFSDNKPYEKIGGLVWPQVVDVPTSGDVFAVSAAQAGNGQEAHPFGGVDVALSAMPAGWTLHLQAGAYPAETLTKPVTILGWNGAVTFGAP
jgi:hypothetical protein